MTIGRRRLLPVACVVLAAAAAVHGAPQSRLAPAPAAGGVPSRIICLIPAVTEMLFAIGAGPKVVAVSSFDHFPPEVEKLPRVGALLDPDVERMLALRPDLVVVYGSQMELRQQLDRAGIPQFVYRHAGLPEIMDTLRNLGARVGHAADGAHVASEIQRALDAIRRRVANRPKPRTLLVLGREEGSLRGIFASGGYGFLHDMLEVAGGTDVFADIRRESVQATSELILARRPEVILELRGSDQGRHDERKERAVWQALSSVPAVRDGRIYVLRDDRVVNPGPRVAEGVELMARALHPDAF